MSELSSAIEAGDRLVAELQGRPLREKAPTMGNLKKCSYTHDALIDLILAHPEYDQNQLAAHFGYTPAWISNILASDALQTKMAARRAEVMDPALAATMKERFQALVLKSLEVLQAKLNAPMVSDTVAIKAAELGAKALGLGGHAAPVPQESSADRLERLAGRLVALQSTVRTQHGEVQTTRVEVQLAGESESKALPQVGGGLPAREGGGVRPDAGESLEAAIRADDRSAGAERLQAGGRL